MTVIRLSHLRPDSYSIMRISFGVIVLVSALSVISKRASCPMQITKSFGRNAADSHIICLHRLPHNKELDGLRHILHCT